MNNKIITIVNYGLGNIRAFSNIFHRLNIPYKIVSTPEDLSESKKLILPGVGTFDWAMNKLNNSGLRETLDNLVLKNNIPVLGVCVGMQIMAKRSEEGSLSGLGWIDAEVKSLNRTKSKQMPLPHMGWNEVRTSISNPLFENIETSRFYFLHSYCIIPKIATTTLAVSNYGNDFTSAIKFKNVFGTQFHPEKSHKSGINLLHNFADL